MNDFDRDPVSARHAAHWEAIEEATELINEERYHEALGALKTALQADATNGYAYFYTGVAMFECGEITAARDAYRAATVLYPEHLGARIALSHCERQLGHPKDAVKEGMIALEKAPGDGDALYAVGMAYYAQGESVPAVRYLSAYLGTGPELEVRLEVEALIKTLGPAS